MSSWQARLATFIVRRRLKPALADMRDIQRVRRIFNQPVPPPKGVRYTPAEMGGVPGEWVEAEQAVAGAAPVTLFYVHGGGFVGCSPQSYRAFTASFALRGLRVFAPDYRLAPEHPFPAPLDDVRAAWRALQAQHAAQPGAGRLVVAGDSAGGNLALALMLALRDAGDPLPDAAALFSPATDLTGESPSLRGNAERDAMFSGEPLGELALAYLNGADPAQPLASPLYGDLRGLPPLLLHVGEDEVLRDDAVRLASKAREAGVRVDLAVWPVVSHVWQMVWRLPEARRSVDAAARFLREAQPLGELEDFDTLIIGAGLSGIGAAVHLQTADPLTRYAVLEARAALGGTWDLFRYPGVRSDSDMHTLGYVFKPWRNPQAIADGPSIRQYIAETAAEHGIGGQIRYGHKVLRADWSSELARWTLQVSRGDGLAPVQLRCRFLQVCSGYYRYDQGHRPSFPGEALYRGTWVHPQHWPAGLDHAGRRVLVIGSGATAVTLVPELARTAAHVTMLQRSPTYVVALPGRDAVAEALRRWLPGLLAYRLVRTKNVLMGMLFFQMARRWPEAVKARLVGLVRQQLGPAHAATEQFSPRYKPWDQRVCVVPDGDLFTALRRGQASVVTGQIDHFTPTGVMLQSGQAIEADIVVTATGLALNVLGDIQLSLDGQAVAPSRTMAYKGMMFSDVPNLAYTFGYTNASWTLKADLTARYVGRLRAYMARHGHTVAVARRDPAVAERPFLDFSSGYVQRALPMLPVQGDRKPWRLYQNYLLDLLTLRFGRIADGALRFGREGTPPR